MLARRRTGENNTNGTKIRLGGLEDAFCISVDIDHSMTARIICSRNESMQGFKQDHGVLRLGGHDG
jgi:hypothetical protein